MNTTLYDYWRSSAAYRLRITLNLLEMPYDQVPVDLLTGEHKQAENMSRNPQGLVPSLAVDDTVLTQSLAIIEYLNETREAGFLPDTPLARARVRRISYAIAMEIHPVCNTSVAGFASKNSGGNLTMQDWMLAFIPRGLAAVETMLGEAETGKYCHGDSLSMADICLMPQVYNARRWGVEMAAMPKINEIATRLDSLAAFSDAHPDRHKP